MGTTVEWLGHCAFRLVTADGIRILIDPFDEHTGFRVPRYEADILLLSHQHYDTQAEHLVSPGYELIQREGRSKAFGIEFSADSWWHDERQGRDFGSVLIWRFALEGVRFCYLSHVGSFPGEDLIKKIGRVDVLFLPVGGMFALGPGDARQMVDELSPGLVIPMHYKLEALIFDLLPLSEFTRLMPTIHNVPDWRLTVDQDSIPNSPIVLQMQHWPGLTPK